MQHEEFTIKIIAFQFLKKKKKRMREKKKIKAFKAIFFP